MTQQTPPPFQAEETATGRRFTLNLRAEKVVRQQKRAVFAGFEIRCDESERIGGDNTAPPPLAYFAASLAF